MFNAEEIVSVNNNWMTIVFIIILLILTLLNLFFGKRLLRTNGMLLNKSYLKIYYNKDKVKFFALGSFLFFILQVFVISLLIFLYLFSFKLKSGAQNFNTYSLILALVLGYFALRFLIGYLFAVLFELKKLFFKISFEKRNYLSNIILWILPLLLLSSYAKYFQLTMLKITLVFFVIMLIFRYVLLLVNNIKVVLNNLFYFILYLCTLEIAPLIIILKLTI